MSKRKMQSNIDLTCYEDMEDMCVGTTDEIVVTPTTFRVTYSSAAPEGIALDAQTSPMNGIVLSELAKKTIHDVSFDYNAELFRSRENIVDMHDTIIAKINDMQYRLLVSWMIAVMDEWGHHDTAVNVAVDVLNRFLYAVNLTEGLFQLAGMAAIWISDKLVHVYPNTCQQYVNMADDAYTKRELQNMEMMILKTLEWRIMQVTGTSPSFVQHRISRMSGIVDQKFVEYLLCTGFTDPMHMKYDTSILADAAVFIANAVFDDSNFGATLKAIADFQPVFTSAIAMLCVVSSLNLRKHNRGGSDHIQDKYLSIFESYSSRDITGRLRIIMDECRV